VIKSEVFFIMGLRFVALAKACSCVGWCMNSVVFIAGLHHSVGGSRRLKRMMVSMVSFLQQGH
jgi:hypothetical protein